jgi:hypothetical protein
MLVSPCTLHKDGASKQARSFQTSHFFLLLRCFSSTFPITQPSARGLFSVLHHTGSVTGNSSRTVSIICPDCAGAAKS